MINRSRRVWLRRATVAVAPTAPFISFISRAQQTAALRRIGMLLVARRPNHEDIQKFRDGLKEAGYVDGSNIVIQYAVADGDYARLPELAAALVRDNVQIIVVEGSMTALAAAHATTSIPIIMASVGDPVGTGLVSSLKHPGGNVTGLSMMIPDLEAKRLQLLKEVIPGVSRVAVWWNPDNPFHQKAVPETKAAGAALAMRLTFFPVRAADQFESTFARIAHGRADAIYILEEPVYFNHRDTLVRLALKARLPSMFGTKSFIYPGGLLSYGVDYGERFHRAASYVVRIVNGARPSDLPIEQPTKFELVINLQTAKALGITIPESILVRADEVIR